MDPDYQQRTGGKVRGNQSTRNMGLQTYTNFEDARGKNRSLVKTINNDFSSGKMPVVSVYQTNHTSTAEARHPKTHEASKNRSPVETEKKYLNF